MKNEKPEKHKNNSITILLIMIFWISIIFVLPVHASSSIQLSDQNIVGGQIFMIYQVNESGIFFIDNYNTTSHVILDDGGEYVFVLKPSTMDYIHNPIALFDLFANSVPGWILVFSALIVCSLGIVILRNAKTSK